MRRYDSMKYRNIQFSIVGDTLVSRSVTGSYEFLNTADAF